MNECLDTLVKENKKLKERDYQSEGAIPKTSIPKTTTSVVKEDEATIVNPTDQEQGHSRGNI